MDAVFSHTTALEIIRRWDSFRLVTRLVEPDLSQPLATGASALRDLLEPGGLLAGTTLPCHLLARSDHERTHGPLVTAHLARASYPSGSFFSPAPGVLCSSPELVAVQMCEYATELELLLLVDELCGYYAIQPGARSGLVRRREPLTSVERIEGYLAKISPVRGSRKLRRALDLARDRSGSPMESRACHRLELAPRQGGYGLCVVGLNDPVSVERIGTLLGEASERIRKPDIMLLAPDSEMGAPTSFRGVGVDYQGGYHREPDQVGRDIERRNELLACDVKVYEVDKDHYDDTGYLDWLVTRIRRDLGIPEPSYSKRTASEMRLRRERLGRSLLAADGLHWTNRSNPLVMAGAADFVGECAPR